MNISGSDCTVDGALWSGGGSSGSSSSLDDPGSDFSGIVRLSLLSGMTTARAATYNYILKTLLRMISTNCVQISSFYYELKPEIYT